MYCLIIANKNYSSWSLRPWVLMRQLGIEFEEQLVVFGQEGFAADSPTRKVPCLLDGERVVWDSLGIVEYLAERHQGVWPKDEPARAWARCAAAEMHSGFNAIRNTCSMSVGVRVRLHTVGSDLQADIDRIQSLWSEGLGSFGGPFLAGASFTAVDAFFAPVVFRFQTYGLELASESQAYRDRVLGLPAMQDWYAAGLQEPWRDEPHDQEVAGFGDVTEDLRAAVR